MDGADWTCSSVLACGTRPRRPARDGGLSDASSSSAWSEPGGTSPVTSESEEDSAPTPSGEGSFKDARRPTISIDTSLNDATESPVLCESPTSLSDEDSRADFGDVVIERPRLRPFLSERFTPREDRTLLPKVRKNAGPTSAPPGSYYGRGGRDEDDDDPPFALSPPTPPFASSAHKHLLRRNQAAQLTILQNLPLPLPLHRHLDLEQPSSARRPTVSSLRSCRKRSFEIPRSSTPSKVF